MKNLARLAATGLLAAFASTAPAIAANDRFTGVAIYPGVSDSHPETANLTCPGNFHLKVSIYMWPATDSTERIVAWYHNGLPGSTIARHNDVHVVAVNAADGGTGAYISKAGPRTMLRLFRATPPPGKRDMYGTKCS